MRRTGSTLIEIAISLPIFTMLMVLAIGGVGQVMRVSRLAKERGQQAYTLAKLEQTVRLDVREANAATVERDASTGLLSLHLSLPDEHRIVYRSHSNRIEREHFATPEKKLLEWFALPSANKVHFEVDGNRSVLMTIHRVHRDFSEDGRLEFFVRSILGRPRLAGRHTTGARDE